MNNTEKVKKAKETYVPGMSGRFVDMDDVQAQPAGCGEFSPSFNGFSIVDVRTFPGEDCPAVFCRLCFNGKKVGEYLDKGDGSYYSFQAFSPYSTEEIERVVGSFPPVVRDDGMGMEVSVDIGILVDRLLEMRNIADAVTEARHKGCAYVLVDDWKHERKYVATYPSKLSDRQIEAWLKIELLEKDTTEFGIRIYRSLDDLKVRDMGVEEKMLFA